MSAVRKALGSDALILETRQADGDVEILAAVEEVSASEPEPLVPTPARGSTKEARQQALRWHGLSDDLAGRLLEDDLAHALTKSLRFGDLLPSSDATLLFVGEPGAGKSLSVLKLSTRLVMAGQTPLVISADGRKAGAIEQLAAMTRLLGLTLVVADDAATLRRAIGRRTAGGPVLIDGPGLIAGDEADDAMLSDFAAAASAETVLVLPAGLDVSEATELAAHYKSLGARRLVPTKLDVSRRIGGIVEASWRSGLMLTEAGSSPSVVDGFSSVTASMLAGRLQRIAGRTDASVVNPGDAKAQPDTRNTRHDERRGSQIFLRPA